MSGEGGERLVTVAAVYNPAQLAVLWSLIEQHGLPVFTLSRHVVEFQWDMAVAFGGVRLCVRESDAAEAKALLADLEPWQPARCLFTGSRLLDLLFSVVVLALLALPPPPRAAAIFLIDRPVAARRLP